MSLDVLSGENLAQFYELKAAGVLRPIEEDILLKHQQVYIVFCGDGKHSLDLTRYHAMRCGIHHENDDNLFHKCALNGGALCVSSHSPLANLEGLPQDRVLLMNLEYALMLKGNDGQIAMYSHAPCGAATLAGHSLLDIVDHGLRAKLRVRTIFRSDIFHGTVGSYLHVCKMVDGEIKRNTYFASKAKWEEWLHESKNQMRYEAWETHKAEIKQNPGWVPRRLLEKLGLAQ